MRTPRAESSAHAGRRGQAGPTQVPAAVPSLEAAAESAQGQRRRRGHRSHSLRRGRRVEDNTQAHGRSRNSLLTRLDPRVAVPEVAVYPAPIGLNEQAIGNRILKAGAAVDVGRTSCPTKASVRSPCHIRHLRRRAEMAGTDRARTGRARRRQVCSADSGRHFRVPAYRWGQTGYPSSARWACRTEARVLLRASPPRNDSRGRGRSRLARGTRMD